MNKSDLFRLPIKVYVYKLPYFYEVLKVLSLEYLVESNLADIEHKDLFSYIFSIKSKVTMEPASMQYKEEEVPDEVNQYYENLKEYKESIFTDRIGSKEAKDTDVINIINKISSAEFISSNWLYNLRLYNLESTKNTQEKAEEIKKAEETERTNFLEALKKDFYNLFLKSTKEPSIIDITEFITSISLSNAITPTNNCTIDINIDKTSAIIQRVMKELFNEYGDLKISENDVVEIRVKYPEQYILFPGEYYDKEGYYRTFIGFITSLTIQRNALNYTSISITCYGIHKLLELQKAIFTPAIGQNVLFEKGIDLSKMNVNIFQNLYALETTRKILDSLFETLLFNASWQFPSILEKTVKNSRDMGIIGYYFNSLLLRRKEINGNASITTFNLEEEKSFSFNDSIVYEESIPSFQFMTYIVLLYMYVKKTNSSNYNIDNIIAYRDGVDVPPYEIAIQNALKMFYPKLETPLSILNNIAKACFSEFFETDQGVLVYRTPKYNHIDLFFNFLTGGNVKTLSYKSHETIEIRVNEAFFIGEEDIIKFTYSQNDMDIKTRTDMHFYFPLGGNPLPDYTGFYIDYSLLIKYGFRPAEPMNNQLSVNPNIAKLFAPLILAKENEKARTIKMTVYNSKPYRIGYLYFIPMDKNFVNPKVEFVEGERTAGKQLQVEYNIYGYVGYLVDKKTTFSTFKGYTCDLEFSYVRKAYIKVKRIGDETIYTLEYKKFPDLDTVLNLSYKSNKNAAGEIKPSTQGKVNPEASEVTSDVSSNGFYTITNAMNSQDNYKKAFIDALKLSIKNSEDFIQPGAITGTFESTVEQPNDNVAYKSKYWLSFLSILDKKFLFFPSRTGTPYYNQNIKLIDILEKDLIFKENCLSLVKAILKSLSPENPEEKRNWNNAIDKKLTSKNLDIKQDNFSVSFYFGKKKKFSKKLLYLKIEINSKGIEGGDYTNLKNIISNFLILFFVPLNKLPKFSNYADWKDPYTISIEKSKSIIITESEFKNFCIILFRNNRNYMKKAGEGYHNISDVILNKLLLSNQDRINHSYESNNYFKSFSAENWVKPPYAVIEDGIKLEVDEELREGYPIISLEKKDYGIYRDTPFDFSFEYKQEPIPFSFDDVFKEYEGILSSFSPSKDIKEYPNIRIKLKPEYEKNEIVKDNALLWTWNFLGLSPKIFGENTNFSEIVQEIIDFIVSNPQKSKQSSLNLKDIYAFNSTTVKGEISEKDLYEGEVALNLIRIT